MTKAYTYILECCDGSYYTGSTIDLESKITQHQDGQGANYTKKRLPVKLVYSEEFLNFDKAFHREKQIQGWSRKKKEALIEKNFNSLPKLSIAYRDKVSSRASDTTRTTDPEKETFYSNGKLLLTGEYVVLDGAQALAIPTKYGQSMTVESIVKPKILWESVDKNGTTWFQHTLQIDDLIEDRTNENEIVQRLVQILNVAKSLNPEFLKESKGFQVTTKLDFPRQWGLGTSSTLINNIAQWAQVNPYKLLHLTFGGSGYDIACASNNKPIVYSIEKDNPNVSEVNFNPHFKNHLYFVYLNKKQNSREGIAHYKKHIQNSKGAIDLINDITKEIITSDSLDEFKRLIDTHEDIIGRITKQIPVKERLFKDFQGSLKSLGAWGGDFVLVCSESNPVMYFNSKGFETVIPYASMVL